MSNISDYIEVTKEDISYAENILFRKTGVFDNDERIPIIKDFYKSFDVNACPGSGKTTVLLAKLIILSRKMPLKNGQGICVLTHTNVAINEIKNKLKDKSDILFKYPNFFGTIQSFIDRYLCIPYYKMKTGNDVKTIGDYREYKNEIIKLSNNYYPSIRYAIDCALKKNNSFYKKGHDKENLIKFVQGKEIRILDNDICICKKHDGSSIEQLSYAKELHKIMYNGVLKYEDTYIFAEAYLNKFPSLARYFSSRFKYVFIDEMQDTKIELQNILSKVFEKEQSTIIQRFGDFNQRIGSSRVECGWTLSENLKRIDSTKRYGNEIIRFLEPLRVVGGSKMSGNNSVKTLNPHIIIFNENNVRNVIDKFNELINKYSIDKAYGNIKVIGKIGVDVEYPDLSITSYTDYYKKSTLCKKAKNKESYSLVDDISLKGFYEDILKVILSSLRNNGKRVSKNEFIKYMQLENENEFILYKANIKRWFCNIKNNKEITFDEMKKKTKELLSGLKKYEFDENLIEEKLKVPESEEEVAEEEVAPTKEDGYINNINEFNTVFGVKGETHLATLYLESKYINNNGEDRSDIVRILDYMIGKKESVDLEDEDALITAYVAMSRAQKLTCIAISYETIQGRVKEFKEYGYEIIPCDKEIEKLISNEI